MSPLAIAAIGAVTTVAGTVAQLKQQRKAASAQKEQQALVTRRNRRQAIRASQIQRAQSVASAQAAGALSGSGAQGGIGALSSQLGSEFGFSTQGSGLSAQIASAQSKASTFGSVAGLGGSIFNFGMGGGNLQGLFSNQASPTSPAQATSYAPFSSPRPVARSF
jgi:hypothetical protein